MMSGNSSSIVVTIFIVGGMIGGLMGGTVADKIGRTKALLYNNALGFCGIVAMFIPKYLDIGMGAYYLFTVILLLCISFAIHLHGGCVPGSVCMN